MSQTLFFLLSIAILLIGAMISLLLGRSGRLSRSLISFTLFVASLVSIYASISSIFSDPAPTLSLFSIPTFGSAIITLDSLSSFLVILISLISLSISIYYYSSGPLNSVLGAFTNIFVASMLFVVTIQNTFFFIVFWELMTLASYFLVIYKIDKKENIITGFIYFLVAHIGAALIMLAFFLIFLKTNSFDFSLIRQVELSQATRNWVFILVLIGFGAKAGMVPLHFWTPNTYALAPHHISALMAGVMKKTAIYGLLRVSIDLLGTPEWWWGFVIIILGSISALFGAFYALPEINIKRLLAYSSVENVGIILLGVGLGVLGLGIDHPAMASLGLLAALYHSLNHAFFKSLLFLSAGNAIDQTQTMILNKMGGLGKYMPKTALAFFLGSLAVTAVPPLNGFISEWITFQSLFLAAQSPSLTIRVFSPLFAVILAFAGAMALMVYIKAYSSLFAGPNRSTKPKSFQEAPRMAMVSMGFLALGCICLGIGAPWISPIIAHISTRFTSLATLNISQGLIIYPASFEQAQLSPPIVAILLLGLMTIPLIVVFLLGGYKTTKRSNVEPWSCGYGYSPEMSISASSFYQPVKSNFQILYTLRNLTSKPSQLISQYALIFKEKIFQAEPFIENVITKPTIRFIETTGQWIQTLQMGDIRVYCLYIIITLAILLITILGRSGL